MRIKLSNEVSLWLRRLALYFSLGAGVIIISHIVFSYAGFLHTDVDSARYMLSALVQGEFAVLAIVVSFSIVASQLAAQSYSTRVIEMFRKNPDLKIIGCIYVLAIFYGLGVLKLLEKSNPEICAQEFICQSTLEAHISFSYYFAIFAATAMVPYVRNTVKLLKPSTIINMLAKELTMDNVLSSIGNDHKKSDDKDPIQPIIDIIRTSIRNFDSETVLYGLKVMEDRFQYILKNDRFENVDKEKIAEHFFIRLNRIGRLAANIEDEDSTMAIVEIIYKLGKLSAEHRFGNATKWALISLVDLITTSKEHKLKGTEWFATIYLEEIEKIAKEHGLEDTIKEVGKFYELMNEALSRLEKE